MEEYIEKMLHMPVVVTEYQTRQRLPLSLSSNYLLKRVSIGGVMCVFATPLSEMNFAVIRKQRIQLEKLTGEICVLHLKKTTVYAKERMIEESIPFVIENKQIYLPFLGVALSKKDDRVIKPCGQISFLTQKLLLTSMYEKWKDVSVTKAAEKLKVTKTAVTHCYDEIEAFELPYIRVQARARLFSVDDNLRNMWNNIKGILRNPVLQQFYLRLDLTTKKILSGLSALGYYSMLDDNPYPIYAVPKKEIKELLKQNEQALPQEDVHGCLVQEVGYIIAYKDGKAIDPISVYLTITKQTDDPRVEKALEEMMEHGQRNNKI